MTKFILAIAMVALSVMTAAGPMAFAESGLDTSGFVAMNADGSFGPYERVDQPLLSDRGGYTQSGERWESLFDQYGNGYYLDLGPILQAAVQPQANAVPMTAPTPVAATSQAPIKLPTPQPSQRAAAEEIDAMLAQVNQERISNGLQPLVEDPALDASAQQYALYEAGMRCYGHDCPGQAFRDRATAYMAAGKYRHLAGECIAWFPDDPVGVVSVGWMQSPPHKAILLHTTMTHFGAGVAVGSAPTQSGPAVDGPMSDAQLGAVDQFRGPMRYYVLDFVG